MVLALNLQGLYMEMNYSSPSCTNLHWYQSNNALSLWFRGPQARSRQLALSSNVQLVLLLWVVDNAVGSGRKRRAFPTTSPRCWP